VSKDIFEQRVGSLLRAAESPVPPSAWNTIRQQLPAGNAQAPFGFGAAIVIGLIALGSLGAYSALHSPPQQLASTDARLSKQTLTTSTPKGEKTAAELENTPNEVPNTEKFSPRVAPEILNVSQIAEHASVNASATQSQALEDTPALEGQALFENLEPRAQLSTVNNVQMPETIPANVNMPELIQNMTPLSTDFDAATAQKLTAAIQVTNLSGFAPFEIDFKALGNFNSVQWDFGPFGKSNSAHTSKIFDQPGVYTVMLTGYNSDQRDMVTDMVTIEVRESSNLVVPDSFTPNGDGINDHFKAEGLNIESFHLSVIDPGGKVVFETRNMDEPWVYHGTPSGVLETYVAVIRAIGVDGKAYNIQQRINIIL
jgi:PKD repeat protein